MFAVPVSTCTNVKRCKDNKTTSSIFYSRKTRDEKLPKTSLMKCQSQLASLKLIRKSWWQCRLPSLLNWQASKAAHLLGITPPFRVAVVWTIWKNPGGNKFQLTLFIWGACSALPGPKTSSNNSTYGHTRAEPQILAVPCDGQPPTCQRAVDRCCNVNLLRTLRFGEEIPSSSSTLSSCSVLKPAQDERHFLSHGGYL